MRHHPVTAERGLAQPERHAKVYALGRANEVFGHRTSSPWSTEAFIAIVMVTATLVALKDCT